MLGHDIIVISASAGGVAALPKLVRSLPEDLPASVFIVLHMAAQTPDLLSQIISQSSALPVAVGVNGESIQPGRVYVAGADFDLLVDESRVRLVRGPRLYFHRPSIDALFRSAADSYGPRVVGVVLTGNLNDGTQGLQAIKGNGGVAIVQAPQDALVPAMPESALANVEVDHCLPLVEIGPLLVRLARQHDIPEDWARAFRRQTKHEGAGDGVKSQSDEHSICGPFGY